MIAGFITRNPGYSVQNVRKLPEVRRAMREHDEKHPACSWCYKIPSDVHHIEPVHVNPDRAGDPSNLISLCRTCHYTIGHGGRSWKDYNERVREMVAVGNVVEDE